MKINHIYQGDCLSVIKTFDNESIDCVITSPPYWQLRDYGWDGQWGLEPTYQMYLKNLWSLMDEIQRVLKKSGTVWFNLGDTYSTKSGGMAQGDAGNLGLKDDAFGKKGIKQPKLNIKDKCLLLIPHRFAIGCIDKGWIVRNDIIWAKRNGMPESVTDRFSKKHEYIFLMTKSTKYYFDLDGIRDKVSIESVKRELRGNRATNKYAEGSEKPKGVHANTMSRERIYKGYNDLDAVYLSKKGKNPGSVSDFWDIPTKPSSCKHYASYNNELIEKPIVAGCPKGGIVLDPFCGTATTGVRALQLDRNFIGIEGSSEYVKIGNELLDVERLQIKLEL